MFDDDKLEAFFRSMSRADKYAMVMEAYAEATKPLITESQSQLVQNLKRRSSTMNLYKSLGFVPDKKKGNSNYVQAKVGARKFRPHKGFHGHLVDAGTAERRTRKGYSRGRMPATNFFTQSVQNTEIQVTDQLKAQIAGQLETMIEQRMNTSK
jgi:hypothetical protein